MHNIKTNFDRIKSILKEALETEFQFSGNYLRQGPKPKFSDLDVITLSLAADCTNICSECSLFNIIHSDYFDDFPNLLSRRQFNDRRKFLSKYIEKARTLLTPELLDESERIYAIDSTHIEICKLSRAYRNKIGFNKNDIEPNRGFCASQNKWFFGYKLHMVCDKHGVILSADITDASTHDVYFLQNEYDPQHISNSILIGDKGYISDPLKEHFLNHYKIDLQTPYRKNQKNKSFLPNDLFKKRKRVETVFSQLKDQFNLQKHYAKSFLGFKTRIFSKLSGLTVLQYNNKFFKNEPIGKLKKSLKFN